MQGICFLTYLIVSYIGLRINYLIIEYFDDKWFIYLIYWIIQLINYEGIYLFIYLFT